ncbi:MAG: di-heme enzyme [Deltaproteobacteria bacterium]|nr:di-heme enzyme [Deltaproteobacteria bacterium]
MTTRLAPIVLVLIAACGDDAATSDPWDWGLPAGFPVPRVPADNPMNADKVELGRRLFYDTRLSGNGTQACASCHVQAHAFAEPLETSVGSTGQPHFRNAMSLTNVAYNVRQTWANPLLVHLEQQALVPMFGESPVELGLAGREAELMARLADDPDYPALFARAFPEERFAITLDTIVKAIAAFQRTLISADSPYDRFWYRKDPSAMSADAIAGFELFFSERLECFHCHGDFNFSSASVHAGTSFDEVTFHNNGLYDEDGKGAYPAGDQGVLDVTGNPDDMGRFKAPTLRNIALTAPYMHDGSIATLDAVIDHYVAGGRGPLKSTFVKKFDLSADERRQLLAFLHALTDTTFVADPRFSDPFAAGAGGRSR